MESPRPALTDDQLIWEFVRSGEAGLVPWCIQYLPHLFTVEPAEFHWEIAEEAEGLPSDGQLAVAAPRGFAKSTLMALGYPLFRAAVHREPFTLLISDTGAQAEQRTSDIFSELLDNTQLIADYPHLALPNAKDYRHQRAKRTTGEFITLGGLRFSSAGVGQSLRGIRERQHRPTLIIADDLENDENVLTPYQRQKLLQWFLRVLKNIPGHVGARIIVIGTILHPEALMAWLLHEGRKGTWRQLLYRAENAQGESLWPQAWPIEKLRRKKAESSRAYAAEYMNDPVGDDIALFRLSWFERNRRVTHPPLVRAAVAVDPSASRDGDECGIMSGGVDERDHGHLIEDATIQASAMTWARVAIDTWKRLLDLDPWAVIIAEKNNGGEMVEATIRAALKPGEQMPPVVLVWASRGKATRAEPIAALVESGQIHHVGEFPEAEKEMSQWTPGMASPNRMDAYVWLWTGLITDPVTAELQIGWAG